MAIDMWSLGCILAELYTGFAILPGEDESDQLACIIELLGMPPKQVVENSKRSKIFFNAKGYPRYCSTKTLDDGTVIMTEGFSRRGISRGPPGSRKLKNALNCDDAYFLQFISECLEWMPEKRLTPEQAFKHSWFKRRLPKLPGGTNSFNGTKQSHTTPNNNQSMTAKDLTTVQAPTASTSSSGGQKGITANCFYYDNTLLHQLPSKGTANINNNQQQSASDEASHKSLPSNMYHLAGGGSATLGKLLSDSIQDLSNRKSMTLNRVVMSSSIHSTDAQHLSLVSSHSSNINNNNNGSSATSTSTSGISSKLPSLN